MQKEGFQEDYSGLRFPVMAVPPGKDILHEIPALASYDPFRKVGTPDRNHMIRFVVLMSDKGSPMMRYKQFDERVNKCLMESGYMTPENSKNFAGAIESIRSNGHAAVSAMIECYLTEIQESYKFLEFYHASRALSKLGKAMDESTDADAQVKTLDALRKMRVAVEELEPEIFGIFSQFTTVKKTALDNAEKRYTSGPPEHIPQIFQEGKRKRFQQNEN